MKRYTVLENIKRNLRYLFVITMGWLHYHISKRFTVRKPRKNLAPIEDITKVSDSVTRVVGQNPGPFTLQGTNTYLIGDDTEKVLIDTTEPGKPRYFDVLAEALGDAKLIAIICTHGHRDHIGCALEVREKFGIFPNIPIYKLGRTDNKPESPIFTIIEDGTKVAVGNLELTLLETRGHTTDHMAIWLEKERIMFSGDCILGEGSSIFEDLSAYMNSLNKIKTYKPEIICPGHGPLVHSTEEKIDEYIRHRVKREKQIVDFLSTVERANALETTSTLYKSLPKSVQIGAFGNIREHLRKLVRDGQAIKIWPYDYQLLKSAKSE